jgi:hypothetical protein
MESTCGAMEHPVIWESAPTVGSLEAKNSYQPHMGQGKGLPASIRNSILIPKSRWIFLVKTSSPGARKGSDVLPI